MKVPHLQRRSCQRLMRQPKMTQSLNGFRLTHATLRPLAHIFRHTLDPHWSSYKYIKKIQLTHRANRWENSQSPSTQKKYWKERKIFRGFVTFKILIKITLLFVVMWTEIKVVLMIFRTFVVATLSSEINHRFFLKLLFEQLSVVSLNFDEDELTQYASKDIWYKITWNLMFKQKKFWILSSVSHSNTIKLNFASIMTQSWRHWFNYNRRNPLWPYLRHSLGRQNVLFALSWLVNFETNLAQHKISSQ